MATFDVRNTEEDSIKVEGKDIQGLIKALQKAVELGWDKK